MPLGHPHTIDQLIRALRDDRERQVERHLREARARRSAGARRDRGSSDGSRPRTARTIPTACATCS